MAGGPAARAKVVDESDEVAVADVHVPTDECDAVKGDFSRRVGASARENHRSYAGAPGVEPPAIC